MRSRTLDLRAAHLEEICQRFPDEWVALVEVDWHSHTDFDFGTARVIGHSSSKYEHYQQAREWSSQYPATGHFFTGVRRARAA